MKLERSDEARLAALRTALIEGEESGLGLPFEIEEFLADKKERLPGSDELDARSSDRSRKGPTTT